MRIVSYNTVKQNLGDTLTVQDFGSFLGESPERLGIAATLYPQNSTAVLLDSLMNIYEIPKAPNMKSSRSMVYEWGVKVNKIKQIEIVDAPVGTGANGSDITVYLKERYYAPNDIFVVDGSRDQFFVKSVRKISTVKWEYVCRFVTNDITQSPDTTYLVRGKTTRWRGSAHPEMSTRGYYKYDSNTELHRNYLTFHRYDLPMSGQYSLEKEVFIETSKGKDKGLQYFKMLEPESVLLKNFMEARNNMLLFGESNFDANGYCTLQDDRGFDIPMGDGIITQVERFADKFVYSKLSTAVFREAITQMTQKSDKPTGNKYVVLCNEDFWYDVETALVDYLSNYQLPATALYSKKADGNVEIGPEVMVGSTFKSFNVQGNQITFMPDRALSYEYSEGGYAVCLDLTEDLESGKPAIELFTLAGAEMIKGTLKGLGGIDGKTSGDMAAPIHGAQMTLAGYFGAAVYNPTKSFIMVEAVSA